MTPSPSGMLAALQEQHATIRSLMDWCDQAKPGPEMWEAVDDLRVALDAHNRYEERLLLPVLKELDAFGEVRIEQMVHDHLNEHMALNEQLKTDAPSAVQAAIALLRAHLTSEERYFVTSRVLRDDVVTLESAG